MGKTKMGNILRRGGNLGEEGNVDEGGERERGRDDGKWTETAEEEMRSAST